MNKISPRRAMTKPPAISQLWDSVTMSSLLANGATMASDNKDMILLEGVNTLNASKDYNDVFVILSGRKCSCPIVDVLQSLLKGFVSKKENGSCAFKHPESHEYILIRCKVTPMNHTLPSQSVQ